MYMTLCPRCAASMRTVYHMSETSRPHLARCIQCIPANITTVIQYELTPKNRQRRYKPAGPQPRDTRARYREPWRGESGGGRVVTGGQETEP